LVKAPEPSAQAPVPGPIKASAKVSNPAPAPRQLPRVEKTLQKSLSKPVEKPKPKPAARPSERPDPLPEPQQQAQTNADLSRHAEATGPSDATGSAGALGHGKSAASNPTPFVDANYRSPSLHNPPTRYPRLALEREWEGGVVLRVQVLANGSAGQVSINHSSGHDLLDDAAIEQVRNWNFLPARKGDQPVDSWVVVPIEFKLKH
jgi:periplasmic protein TonB